MPEQGKKSIAFPADVHQRVKVAAVNAGVGIEQFAAQGLDRVIAEVNEDSPLKRAIAVLPDDVIRQLSDCWKDMRVRKCILALLRVWDVGDREIIEAVARDLSTFQRMTDLLEQVHGRSRRTQTDEEQRAKSLYSDAGAVKPGHPRGPDIPGGAPPGGRGNERLGKRPVRRARKSK